MVFSPQSAPPPGEFKLCMEFENVKTIEKNTERRENGERNSEQIAKNTSKQTPCESFFEGNSLNSSKPMN